MKGEGREKEALLETQYLVKGTGNAGGVIEDKDTIRRCIFDDWPACPRQARLPEDGYRQSGCAASDEERLRCSVVFGRGRRIFPEFVPELEQGFQEFLRRAAA